MEQHVLSVFRRTANTGRMARHGGRFLSAKEAVAAIEFALVAPLLVVLFAGAIELHNFLRVSRLLEAAADSVAGAVANRRSIKDNDLFIDYKAVAPLFPPAVAAGGERFFEQMTYRISHVAMKPTVNGCAVDCTYTGELAWTWFPRITETPLTCGAFSPGSIAVAPVGRTLPVDFFGPASVIVVEFGFDYQPLFGTSFMQPFRLSAKSFSAARFAQGYIKAATSTQAITICPGY